MNQSLKARMAPRRAFTLMETVMAMAPAAVLMAGLASSVLLTTRSFRPETATQYARTSALTVQRDLLSDLQQATSFTERTPIAATFTVPDRDGDGRPETLRYAWGGVPGLPLTLSYNGGAAVNVMNDVRMLSMQFTTQTLAAATLPVEQSGDAVLLLVNDSSSLKSAEQDRRSLIESWNFAATVRGSNDSKTSILAAAAASKAIYICNTVDPGILSTVPEIATQAIGVVNEHPDLVDDIGFAKATDESFAMSINVQVTTHYITAGQSTGNLSAVLLPVKLLGLSDAPAPQLRNLATVGSSPGLATIDPAKPLWDGRTAAGRRVFLPWGASYDVLYMSPEAKMISSKALEWAAGRGSVTNAAKNLGFETAYTTPLGSLANMQVATKVTLSEKAAARSITAYVGGETKQSRVAIYADASGKPGARISQSQIVDTKSSMSWITYTIPEAILSPGDYWIAIALDDDDQRLRIDAAEKNATLRVKSFDGVDSQMSNPWGASTSSSGGAISIYLTYEPLN